MHVSTSFGRTNAGPLSSIAVLTGAIEQSHYNRAVLSCTQTNSENLHCRHAASLNDSSSDLVLSQRLSLARL